MNEKDQLTARQLACKAIHTNKENVRNPSIMAKYMNEHTNHKLNKIVEELEKIMNEKLEQRLGMTLERNFSYKSGLIKAIAIIKKGLIKNS